MGSFCVYLCDVRGGTRKRVKKRDSFLEVVPQHAVSHHCVRGSFVCRALAKDADFIRRGWSLSAAEGTSQIRRSSPP